MKKFLLSILMLLMVTLTTFGQTTLISPTGNGGFETGATFLANGWTVVNDLTNTWQVGAVAVPYAGTNSAFVSSDGGVTYSYDNAEFSTSHFYMDVTVPAGETFISLSFQWKGNGESGWDRLLVYTAPTSVTPVAGIPIANATTITGATLLYTQTAFPQAAYGVESFTLPTSLAGTTFRLIFTWQNDDSFGTNPPASIDNISLTSTVPPPPLTGIKTIDPAGSGVDNYVSFALAIADLNFRGVGTGGVTFNVAAGATFAETPKIINITGTLANPIVFQKSGVGDKPIVNFTGTSAGSEACFRLNAASYITFDGLDIRDAGTALATYMEHGFALYGSATVGCQNNTFKNCVVDLTKANTNSRGIYFSSAATAASGSNSYNKFYNLDVKDCNYGYYVYGNSTYMDNGNEIGTESGGASLISDLGPTTSTVYAVYAAYQTNCKIFNTTLSGIANTSGAINGFYLWGTGSTFDVYSNDIHTLSTTGANVTAIYQSSGLTLNVYKNKIYDLSYSGTSTSIVYGMALSGGTTLNIYNNFIYDLRATTATSSGTGANIRAISLTGGTNAYVYYNTVYLNYTSAGATNQSAALYVGTTPTVDLRNNIFVNNVDATVGTRAVAFYKTTTSVTNIAGTTNNNLYYCGTPGAKNLIFYNGTNSDQTLAEYQTRVGPARENASVTENPPFVSGVSPFDLQLSTTIPTLCESGGVVISTPNITTDYFGDARFPNSGYPDNILSPAVAPDLGADEFGGRILDTQPPVISYTALMNTSSTGVRTLNVTVTDIKSGVPVITPGWPTLYWKIGAALTYTAVAPSSVAAGVYTYDFGAGVVLGDEVFYYVVAQDLATIPNVGSFPSAGAGGFTINPPACSTPPTTPSSYTILGTISGVFHVGVGLVAPNYVTLTEAVDDLNNKVMSGPVTFILDDATYTTPAETFPIAINNNPGSSATNTLTIKPNTSVTPLITTTGNAWTLWINGADYVTIDGSNSGGTDKSLTVENLYTTALTAPIIIYDDGTGATNNTLKNCIFKGGSNTSTNVYGVFVNYQVGAIFANTTIQNNTILKAYYGMQFAGYAGSLTTGGVIQGNTFGSTTDAESIGTIGISMSWVNGGLVSNNLFQNFRGTSSPKGIQLSNGTGVTISNNTITNFLMGTNPTGIFLYTNASNTTVNANNITGLIYPGTTGYGGKGIDIQTGLTASNLTITNNTISNISGDGYSGTSDIIVGIRILGTNGSINIYHNSINLYGDISRSGATNDVNACLYLGGVASNIDLRDNIFRNSIVNTTGVSTSYAVYSANPNTAFTSINYNDYFVSGVEGVLGYLGANQTTLADWKTATGQDVASQSIDPVFTSSTDLLPTAVALENLGTYITSVPTDYAGVTRSNPPDMGAYEFGTPPAAWVLTDPATLITGVGATLNGNGSGNGSTVTTSFEYGLTTSYGSTVAAIPATISGVPTTTFSAAVTGLVVNNVYHYRAVGQIGSGTPFYGPDLTFTTLAVPTLTTEPATLVNGAGATLNGTVNANGFSSDVTFEYGLTTAYGSSIVGVPGTVTGSATTPFSAVVTGLTPLTEYHYRAVGVNSYGTNYGADATFTTLVMPLVVGTVSGNQTVCTGATPIALTSTPPNGGTPSYQWQSSLDNTTFTDVSGANAATYLPLGLTTTTYFRQMQNAAGTSGGPLPTNSVIVDIVNYPAFVIGNIAASQTLCYGSTAAELTSTPPNGITPTYQWQSSLTNVPANFGDISGATLSTYAPGALTTTTYYRQVQNSDLTCGGPGVTNVLTLQVYPNFAPGMIAASQSICSGITPALLTGTAPNGTTPTYQWQSSVDNTTFTNISGATTLNYQPGALTSTTWYRTMQNSSETCGGPLPTNSISVTIMAYPPLAPGIIAASQGICSGETPALLTSTPPNGILPIYQWQSSLTNVPANFTDISGATLSTYQPGALATTTYYRQIQNASTTCGGPLPTNVITISMNPALLVGSIGANQTICNSTAPALLTGVAPSNGTLPTYQWQSSITNVPANFTNISGATLINYQPGVLAVTTYFRQLQNASGTCGGPLPTNVVTITVSAIPVATASNSGPVCLGSTLNLFGGPDGMATYAWSGPNGFTSTLQNPTITSITEAGAGDYSLIVTNTAGCISAAATTTVVIGNSTATASNNGPICSGLTLNLLGGPDGMASYAWTGPNGFVSGLQNPSIPNVPMTAAGVYTLTINNTLGCPGTATTTVVLYESPVATASNNGPLCEGATLNLTGGPDGMVTYAWTGPNGFTSDLQSPTIANVTMDDAGVYTLTATNAIGCSTSVSTTVEINAIPDAPVITEDADLLTSSAPAGNQWYYSATSGGTGDPIAGATGQTYLATLTGYYWSIVTLNGCISPESNHLYVVITGMSENRNTAGMVIYPVPNEGKFTLSISSPKEDTFTVNVYNKVGQSIYELRDLIVKGEFNQSIDLRPVAAGVYTVVLHGNNSHIVKKIVINK